jgi:Cutinase
MKGRIADIAKSCPDTKIVLLGYSQGGGVIGNVLCGGGGEPDMGPLTPPIADSLGKHGKLAQNEQNLYRSVLTRIQ